MADELPVVSVLIVTDINKCPGSHFVIDKTYNGSEEADLWKDGLFGRRVTRYLCVEKAVPAENQDVLVDVAIINEKDPVPPGFTVLDYTQDTRERALKKRLLCVRWMNPSITNDAITELIFMSKSTRKPPSGYTLIGELNHLAMCYKMGRLAKTDVTQVTPNLPYQFGQQQPGYPGVGGGNITLTPLGSSLPYAMNPTRNQTPSVNGYQTGSKTEGNHPTGAGNPLNGVPWQLNSRFKMEDITIPEIRYKSLMDVENEYAYNFRVEKTAIMAAEGS